MKPKKKSEKSEKKPIRKPSTAAKPTKTVRTKAAAKTKKPAPRKRAAVKKAKVAPRKRVAPRILVVEPIVISKSPETARRSEEPVKLEAPKPIPVEAKPEIRAPVVREEKKPLPKPVRSKPLKIPPILLEGDKPSPAPLSGPGERYSLGPKPPAEKLSTEGELPESYGTQHLMLTARDPHWLYAHWDLTRDQQRKYNAFSRDGHLALRVYADAVGGNPETEIQLHPDSNHWFVPAKRAGARYVAELGYKSAADKWTVVATSGATMTPPDKMSAETEVEFTTIPLEVPLEKLFSLVKEAVEENPPLAQAMQEMQEERSSSRQATTPAPAVQAASPIVEAPTQRPVVQEQPKKKLPAKKFKPSAWTPAQERALAEIISMDHVRRVWMGSLEITELIRRQFMKELTAKAERQLAAGPGGVPTSPAGAPGAGGEVIKGISSPTIKPGRPGAKGFWFNVNAELIIYGATEPDATVTIAGRRIKLRRDGSFSYRFALPDGDYELPVVAVSADQTDGRAAELKFGRSTEYRGDVGHHPQDAALKTPVAESF